MIPLGPAAWAGQHWIEVDRFFSIRFREDMYWCWASRSLNEILMTFHRNASDFIGETREPDS